MLINSTTELVLASLRRQDFYVEQEVNTANRAFALCEELIRLNNQDALGVAKCGVEIIRRIQDRNMVPFGLIIPSVVKKYLLDTGLVVQARG